MTLAADAGVCWWGVFEGGGGLHAAEVVAHAGTLRFEVAPIGVVGRHFEADLFDDIQAVDAQSCGFLGVVGEDADAVDAEIAEDLGAGAVVAFVGGEAEGEIGIDGVHAFVLEFVGFDLVGEADAAAFLSEIDEDATAFVGDHGHGGFELLAAIAAHGAEDIAGEAFAMDAGEDGLFDGDCEAVVVASADIAHAECDVHAGLGGGAVGDHSPGTEAVFELDFVFLVDESLALEAIFDEVGDGAHFDVVQLAELGELWDAGHGAVVV